MNTKHTNEGKTRNEDKTRHNPSVDAVTTSQESNRLKVLKEESLEAIHDGMAFL